MKSTLNSDFFGRLDYSSVTELLELELSHKPAATHQDPEVNTFRNKMSPFKRSQQTCGFSTETSIRVEKKSSKIPCTDPMSRYPEAMRNLRIAASSSLKNIGVSEPPEKVTFNGQPITYQGRKTLYIWKVKHERLRNDEEESAALKITTCDTDNRKPYGWSDAEIDILTSLIKQGGLFPELYHCNSSRTSSSHLTPQESDAEERESFSTFPHSPFEDNVVPVTLGEKRRRSPSIELGSDPDDSSDTEPLDTIFDSSSGSTDTDAATLYPLPTVLSIETRKRLYKIPIRKRCRLDSLRNPEADITAIVSQQDTEATQIQQAEAPPRLMSRNAAGLLDFLPPASGTPLPQLTDEAVAPIAVSPTEFQLATPDDQVQPSLANELTHTDGTPSNLQVGDPDSQDSNGIDEPPDFGGVAQAEEHVTSPCGVPLPLTAPSVEISTDDGTPLKRNVSSKDFVAYMTSFLEDRDITIADQDSYIVSLENRIAILEERARVSEETRYQLQKDMETCVEKERVTQEEFQRLRKDLDASQANEELLRQNNESQLKALEDLCEIRSALEQQVGEYKEMRAKIGDILEFRV
ncbi:hypothetical protein TWF694_009614 [Orbilia ellipsospora]|uniref:Uncharacterized protein n=1 Tax=Orbilia ellipsospora TaxID=2528407 RepID=A0AAV9XC70_9PEZI